MSKPKAMPDEGGKLLERLGHATASMPALEEEVNALQRRAEHADVSAIHLGLRLIAEALLRHGLRAEGASVKNGPGGTLNALREGLQAKMKGRISEEFWRHLDDVQRRVNPNTHYQGDDVYHASALRRGDPWDEILGPLRGLVCMAEEFVHHWPPPTVLATAKKSSVPPAVGVGAAEPDQADGEFEESDLEEAEEDLETGDRLASIGYAGPELDREDVAELTVAQARDDDGVRSWLAANSSLQQRGVSRRLNAAHGKTKLRNLFPDAFESDAEDEHVEPQGVGAGTTGGVGGGTEHGSLGLDYESIGNLTIKEARELEVAEDIATLCGLSPVTVRRKLRELHGGGVVRRQFSWYEPEVIAELTVTTARRYHLAPLLARVFDESPGTINGQLSDIPGQIKLRTVFPMLLGTDE